MMGSLCHGGVYTWLAASRKCRRRGANGRPRPLLRSLPAILNWVAISCRARVAIVTSHLRSYFARALRHGGTDERAETYSDPRPCRQPAAHPASLRGICAAELRCSETKRAPGSGGAGRAARFRPADRQVEISPEAPPEAADRLQYLGRIDRHRSLLQGLGWSCRARHDRGRWLIRP